jgi:polyhydroxyalkanoate synthesis regulator phasin
VPKKKHHETQAEQSERFRKTVRDLVAAGELDPTEADKAFEKLSSQSLRNR